MKKLKTLTKMLLVAVLLGVGVNDAWATVTPVSESYSSTSTTTGWSTSVSGRFTPTILNESENYYLSVVQDSRDNNGCVVTGTILSGKAVAGDDFTLMFDMRVGSSNDQNPVSVVFQDAAGSGVIFSVTATGKNVTTWTLNGTSTQVTLPNSGPNTATDGTAITGITWCSYKISRSGSLTYVTITNKSTGVDIFERALVSGASSTGGLGNIVFTTRRKYANFAIDNIVLRELQSGDVPAAEPTTCTVKFQNAGGTTLKADATINTVEGASVNADEYAVNFTEAGQKYIYVSGNETITADADASKNVITLIYRAASTWSYSITAVDGEESLIQVVSSGSGVFEGDTKTAFFPKAFNKDGTWYQTSSGASGASYFSFSLNESNNAKNVTYSTTSDITYFFECEDLTIVTKRDDGSQPERASNGGAPRLGIGGYLYTSALAAGVYTLKLNCNNPNSGNPTLTILLWDGEKLIETGKTIVKDVEKQTNYGEVETTDIVIPEGMCLALKNETSWNSNASLDYLILKKTGEVKTIGTYGYATFSSTYPVDFTGVEGLKAYKATAATTSTVTMEEVTGAVAANTGLVLKGAAGTYNIPIASSGTTLDGNLLFGCDGSFSTVGVAGSGTNFVLSVQSEKVVWAPVLGDEAPIRAGQAALWANVTVYEARGLRMVFEDETTGIQELRNSKIEELKSDNYYNLNGQRVEKPSKGLYIVNGRKVIMK